MKSWNIKGKVFVWPGVGGWHFVYVDKDTTQKIKKVSKTYGAGFVKIKAKINKTEWDTSLFPYKKENVFLISIKKEVRKKEDVFPGEEVKIKINLI